MSSEGAELENNRTNWAVCFAVGKGLAAVRALFSGRQQKGFALGLYFLSRYPDVRVCFLQVHLERARVMLFLPATTAGIAQKVCFLTVRSATCRHWQHDVRVVAVSQCKGKSGNRLRAMAICKPKQILK